MAKSKKNRVMDKTNSCCWYCGIKLRPKIVTIDHIIPISKGGKSEIDNLVASCKNCNFEKGSLTVEMYRLQLAIYEEDGPELNEEQLEWVSSFLNKSLPVFYGESKKSL